MEMLLVAAEKAGSLLRTRRETVAVAESSAGGLISASLLALSGASAYFMAGGVVYTKTARESVAGITDAQMVGLRSSSEPYAALLARSMRERNGTVWGLAETGAAGPTGNRYGDAAGHTCIAISGPVEHVLTLETGDADRLRNMHAFAQKALEEFAAAIARAG